MTLRKYLVINILLLSIYYLSQAQVIVPERAGWWKFDDPADLLKAEEGFGLKLDLTGSHTSAAGPDDGNGSVLIGPGSYYKLKHTIPGNGSGIYVNEYSLQFDFKIPANSIWHSFFQTSIKNNDDGDFFINPSGNIGVAAVGYSSYSVIQNEWYRLLISVKNGSFFTCYLDGDLLMTGKTQAIDGRFSLDSLLLIFADDNAEDGSIYCSELSIWNQALNTDQVKELGGFGHDAGPLLMTRIPYLQGPGTNTMNVCWHDTNRIGTKVEYGIDSTLNLIMQGSSEIVSEPYRWHTVKLAGLQPNTRYFYKVASGNGTSGIHSFKTLPDTSYTGKIRFVILSDTHETDTTRAGIVLRAAKVKISELYGPDIENHVNGIFHSGDIVVSGNSPGQYTAQYFQPFSALSGNIPTMTVAGNHEGENPFFYNYMNLNDQSAFPQNPGLIEKVWQMRVGNSLFIGLNTNIIDQYGKTEADWLDSKLEETEQDSSIEFVFLFFHHPPFSELWFDVSTFDGGPDYVKKVLFPIIKKYTKVQQIHTGHTHGFERGTIVSDNINGDFRIICGGGGGGLPDTWGSFTNYDYNDIHIAFDHYCFQILEIDIADHSWQNSMYSLGNINKPRNSELLDNWYKKVGQTGPETPVAENAEISGEYIQFRTSEYKGVDSLMTVELQVIDSSDNSCIVLDSLVNWKNIYGVDKSYNPVDKNRGINLYQLKINVSLISGNKSYFFHVRYRDHNLKWSYWSNSYAFSTVGITDDTVALNDYFLYQNFPNPFQNNTVFTYTLPERSEVNFRIFDTKCRIVADINEGTKNKGTYRIDYQAENLSSGLYCYKLITSNLTMTKKMIKMK
jgi:hypothetical protein